MRADRGRRAGCAVLALAGWLMRPVPALAQDWFGNLQLQYQRVDLTQLQLQSNGSLLPVHRVGELWIQSYEANQRSYPGPDLLLQTQLRFVGQADVHGPNSIQSPLASMRLIHPYYNLLASYQPVISKTAFQTPTGIGDSTVTQRLTAHYSETQFIGHAAPPRLPQLDLQWIHRFRDDTGFASKEHSDQQTARLSYSQPWWNAYAGITHQSAEREGSATVPLEQRVGNAGGSVRLDPRPDASVGLSYDLADTRSGVGGSPTAITTSQAANLTGNWRFAPRWSADLNWVYHHMVSNQLLSGVQNDQDGVAIASWLPSRPWRLTAGGGLRTVRLTDGSPHNLEYMTATAALDDRVRRDWQLIGNLAHTTNWDPELGRYSVETFGITSRMDARRRAHLDVAWQMTASGDSASASDAVNIAWGMRLDLMPLRSLVMTGALRSNRVGPGLIVANGVTRTRSFGFTWRPTTVTTLIGAYSLTGLLPNDSPRNSTWSLTGQYAPSSRLQLNGVWSRSTQVTATPLAGVLVGTEVASARLTSALTRRFTAAAGVSVSDPGKPQHSKQYDATMTWSFGR